MSISSAARYGADRVGGHWCMQYAQRLQWCFLKVAVQAGRLADSDAGLLRRRREAIAAQR